MAFQQMAQELAKRRTALEGNLKKTQADKKVAQAGFDARIAQVKGGIAKTKEQEDAIKIAQQLDKIETSSSPVFVGDTPMLDQVADAEDRSFEDKPFIDQFV